MRWVVLTIIPTSGSLVPHGYIMWLSYFSDGSRTTLTADRSYID